MPTDQSETLRSLLSAKSIELCRLKDIGTTRSWDYSLPTIGAHRGFTDRHNFSSDYSFFEIFEKDVNCGLPYNILQNAGVFDKGNSIVLFGGCILDIIFKRHRSIKDFDLRLVGEEFVDNEAKCVNKAKEFVGNIFCYLLNQNKEIDERKEKAKNEGRTFHDSKIDVQNVIVTRSRSTVSVRIPRSGNKKNECLFQLAFSPAKSIEEMLEACQPHCTRLAIKDGDVVLDQMARFCIESTCIVLDASSFVNYYRDDVDEESKSTASTSGRSISSQIQRVMKYYNDKGFDIILPELDMTKAPRRNLEYGVAEVLALPNMIVVYDEIRDNIIMAKSLDLPKHLKAKISGPVGAYDSEPTENVGEAIHFNIRCLVHDVYDSFKFVAKGERYEQVFDFVPDLTPRMVNKSYETVDEKLEKGTIPINTLTGYFSVTPPDEVVAKLIAEPMKNMICKPGKLPHSFDLDKDLLKDLIHKEISSLVLKIEGLREKLVERGLCKLIFPYPDNVSTVDEVLDAFYGSNRL